MKPGDLVKMKFTMWWTARRKDFIKGPAIVVSRAHNAIKLLLPDGNIKTDVIQNWEVINEK